MKNFYKLLIVLSIFCLWHFTLTAQDKNQAIDLIKEGNILQGQHKYPESIDKFNEALKADSGNANAKYQLAYSLFASNNATAAIPYLEKVISSPLPGLIVAAYSLMGTIYDEGHQPQKAIDAFNQAIKLAPNYPQIYYNIGLAYFRNNQYADAETAAIEAIKRDPKNASNQRLYALVCFHQNKRGNALLSFCSFLLADEKGTHTVEALTNMESILRGGVLKESNGKTAIPVKSAEAEVYALNTAITTTAAAAQAKKLTSVALLEYELNSIITTADQLSEKKTEKSFFDKFFADYLYKLVQSGNLPAFAHTVSVSIYKDEDTKWLNDNPDKVAALKDWEGKTERGF